MIAANERVFARLTDVVGDLIPSEILRQKRAVRTNSAEKRWLQHLVLRTSSHLLFGPNSKFALGEYDGDFYLIAIGLEGLVPPIELERVDVNSGMFTAIVSELDVPVLRSMDIVQQLQEYIFYPVQQNVELLDMDLVKSFFQRIDVFRVDATSGLALDKELGLRVTIAAVIETPEARPLEWPNGFLEKLSYMVRDPKEQAPFHLLLRAVTEVREDSAFLAVYRCIEQLFPIPAIAELSAALKLSDPALQVAATIEQYLGWRRREEDAIAHLFGELDQTLVDRMLTVLGLALSENTSRPVAKRVYELRNQCVHYRPVHGSPNGGSLFSGWLLLTELLLEVVQNLYARYTDAFTTPVNSTASA